MFFAEENNARVLAGFLRKAEAAHIDDVVRTKRLSISREIIGYIYKSPEGWDDRCSFNIKHIGDQFIEWLRDFDPSKPADIDYIYSMSYRFLCEFDFLVGAGKELSMELRSIKNKIQQDTDEIDDNVRSQIIYASFIMPANIAKEFINDANIGVFKDFEKKKLEAEKLKSQWDEEIQAKESAVNALRDKLAQYKTAFNFVGLYEGFTGLAEKKKKEAFWLFVSLICMGVLILTPFTAEIFLTVTGIIDAKTLGLDHLMVLLPLISIEVILIYFFRVILLNHRSVKAQIMQIELRQTLCQFIQDYTEYSSKIKKEDAAALEKFESLIFSGVLSDPEKLPSTFDGMEQIGNLIKSIKNS